ncbi:MAG: hypothetical protein IPM98_16325 [Lewinellaceae bacterium]|nr:hypothetical protein [Lewinellaceae bacterium]
MYSTPQKKRRPLWLRMFLTTGIVVAILAVALVLLAAFFSKQITRRVLEEVSNSLRTELEVRDAGLSLLSGFPNASVNLADVRVKDAFGKNLLVAREVAFRFKITSLFGDRIEIKNLRISGGGIAVRINQRGQANYDIFKTAGQRAAAPADSGLRIALENAELVNLLLSYQNAKTNQIAEINLRSAGFAGDFSAQKFDLSSQADLTVARLQLDQSRYLLGKTVRYNAVIAVDIEKGLFDFQNVELTVGGNAFTVEGIAVNKPDYTDLNLKLLGQEGDVSVVVDLLPEPYHSYFSDFQSSGAYTFTGFVRGRAGKTQTPTVGAEATLRNGSVRSEKLQSPLRNVSFRAVYSAPPDGRGVFEIADFQADFGGQPLAFNLKITDLDDPSVDFQCHGALPLNAAYGLFDDPAVTAGDGIVRINRLSVQGRYADMTSMSRIAGVRAGGEMQFEEAEITYNGVPINFRSGRLMLEDNLFALDSLDVQVGRSDFAFRGSARNLLPVLFADSLNTTDALLEFSGSLHARQFDITQFMAMLAVQEDAVEGGQAALDSLRTAANTERQRLTDRLKGAFSATFEAFEYEKIQGKNFVGQLALDHNQLVLKGGAQTMQGAITLDGIAHFAISPTLQMRITATDIDLRTCMEQCDNFGQSVMTADNLRGRLSGRVVVYAFWDERNEFLMDKLRAYTDVTASNGELVGLPMLEEFSTFIHIEDLRRVKFTTMHNYLEIRDRNLYLPAMLIQSNALNMTLSGTHSFDNDIDYKIKVNAGQTLLSRIKRHDPDLDPLPARDGLFNVFYTIVGNLDQYDMKRGKKTVKAEFERSEARKKVIATAIDNAFRGVDTRPAPEPDDAEYLDPITGSKGRPGAVQEH